MAPTPPGFVYVDPGPGVADVPDLPPLIDAFAVVPRPGGGYVLDGLSARVGADSLHQGPIQVMLEAAALDVARDAAGDRCDLCRAHRCDARAARQDRPLRRDRARAGRQRAHRRLPRGAARRRRRRACRRDRLLALPPRLTASEEPAWARLPESERRFTLDDVRSLCAQLPPPRINRIHDVAEPRAAATLVPIVDVDGEAAVVLTKRPATMLHHRGDWVFPGGRVDPETDAASRDAARREADEELGIPADRVEIVGQLDTHGPIVTGFVIEVFVGVIDGSVRLAPDPREVSEVVTVPLSCFMRGASFAIGRRAPEHDPGRAPTAPRRRAPVATSPVGWRRSCCRTATSCGGRRARSCSTCSTSS